MNPRTLLVVLILAAAALFVVGVVAESSQASSSVETTGGGVSAAEGGDHVDQSGSDPAEASEAHAGDEGASELGESGSEAEEGLFGFDLEALPLVVAAVVFSVALAAAVWIAPNLIVLTLAAVVMVVFAGLDVREVIHQIGESAGMLAVLAAVVALLHAAAGLTAMRAMRVRPSPIR